MYPRIPPLPQNVCDQSQGLRFEIKTDQCRRQNQLVNGLVAGIGRPCVRTRPGAISRAFIRCATAEKVFTENAVGTRQKPCMGERKACGISPERRRRYLSRSNRRPDLSVS